MKKALLVLLVLFIGASYSLAKWEFEEDFFYATNPHGVVVDPDGKIWIITYKQSTDTVFFTDPADTMYIRPIYIFNPDGSQADFSPLKFYTYEGQTDTMDYYGRGITKDQNGNIIFTGTRYSSNRPERTENGGKDGVIMRFDYKTGELLTRKVLPPPHYPTRAAVDENGFTYVGYVVAGTAPTYILDEDFEVYNYVIEENSNYIARGMAVSPDGKDVFIGTIYSSPINGVLHYHSDDGPDGTYECVDTLGSVFHYDNDGNLVMDKAMWGQSVDFGPYGDKKMLYVGTYWDVNENDFRTWYILDPENNYAIVDSFGTPGTLVDGAVPVEDTAYFPPKGDQLYAPRFADWTADGKTMYTCDFDGNVVKKWVWVETDVKENKVVVNKNFDLGQNYPNPFNPETVIPFSLKKEAKVTLAVYDLTGRKVKTLVNSVYPAGNHKVTFKADGIGSGVYFYRLTVDKQSMVKTMVITK